MFTHTAELPITGRGSRHRTESPRWNVPIYLWLLTAVLLFCALRAASLILNSESPVRRFMIPAGTVKDFGLRASHGRLYRGEVTAAVVHVGESQPWIVHLEQRNGRRLGHAVVHVRVWMPETGIESPPSAATYIGRGEYRLDAVRLTRRGWWNVALVVDGLRGVDSLAFNVQTP